MPKHAEGSRTGVGTALDIVPLPPEDEQVLTRLFDAWETLAEDEDVMPAISPLAFKLLELDTDTASGGGELTQIIESDPVLTGRILGLANSAAFASAGKPIFEIKQAVLRLGVDAVLEAAFAQLAALWMRQVCKLPEQNQLHGLWLEYLITGFCAREVALTLRDDEASPSLAYASGLLHDVGTLALSCSDPDVMSRFIRAGYCPGTPLHERFVQAHQQLGAALLRRWGTPVQLTQVAARHHAGFSVDESATTMVVFLADHLHQAIVDHERSELRPPEGFVLGCFGGATESISAALLALGLADHLGSIIQNVAAESERIETLAAAVSG